METVAPRYEAGREDQVSECLPTCRKAFKQSVNGGRTEWTEHAPDCSKNASEPIDLGAILYEKQEVIYSLMKQNEQLRHSSARLAEENKRLQAMDRHAYRQCVSQRKHKAVEAERDEARAEAAKLREERDAAEAVILEEYESWGADCSDDLVGMAKEILRGRKEKGGA